MQFLTAAVPPYGEVERIAPVVRRVTARNPSKFTYHGTGTYIVGNGDPVVIDPGPAIDEHRDALRAALDGERIQAILVTHCHSDHSPLSGWLSERSGAPTYAVGPHGPDAWDIGRLPPGALEYPVERTDEPATTSGDAPSGRPVVEESIDRDFAPDVRVTTGDVVATGPGWSITALPTPGHTANHCCWVLDDGAQTSLFTGDHVMGWSTTVVGPPDGDMRTYLASLELVAARPDQRAYPTHGPPIEHPSAFVSELIAHRRGRERQILDAVRRGRRTIPEIVVDLYADVHPRLHKPAAASVLAHLVALVDDGAIATDTPHPRLDGRYEPSTPR